MRHKISYTNTLLVISAILLILACKKHTSVTGPDTVNKNAKIGSKGGEAASKDSSAILIIPPDALSSEISFTFDKVSNSTPSGSIGTVWNIGPNGTQFDTSAILSLEYNPSNLPDSIDASRLRLATVSNSKWDTLTSVSDTSNHRVHGLIHHLSKYALISIPKGNSYPSVSSIKPHSGMAGDTVMVYGNNFGTDATKVQIGFNNTSSRVLDLTNTQIKTIVPDGATTGPIRVIVDGKGVQGPTFTIQSSSSGSPPVIESIVPDSVHHGDTITINGRNFIADPQKDNVVFNVSTLAVLVNPTSATSTQLKVTVPDKAQTDSIHVNVGSYIAKGPVVTILRPAPDITGISPTSGSPGSQVTISGDNFIAGSNGLVDNFVYFGGIRALNVTSATSTQLVVTVPDSAETGPVSVDVLGQIATGPQFTVQRPKPVIDSINPTSGIIGTGVTITGNNFSLDTTYDKVTFNGISASIKSVSQTQIKTNVPEGATSGPVSVTAFDQTVQGPQFNVTPQGEASLHAYWGLPAAIADTATKLSIYTSLIASTVKVDTGRIDASGDKRYDHVKKYGEYAPNIMTKVLDLQCNPIAGREITDLAQNGTGLKYTVTENPVGALADFSGSVEDSAGAHKTINIKYSGDIITNIPDSTSLVQAGGGNFTEISRYAESSGIGGLSGMFLHIDNPTGHAVSLKISWNYNGNTSYEHTSDTNSTSGSKISNVLRVGILGTSSSYTSGCGVVDDPDIPSSESWLYNITMGDAGSPTSGSAQDSHTFTISGQSVNLLVHPLADLSSKGTADLQQKNGTYEYCCGVAGTASISGNIKIQLIQN